MSPNHTQTAENDLVTRALSTIPRSDIPAGLADRAFAAAMRAPPVSSWTTLLTELFAVARVGALCAAGVAAVVFVVSRATANDRDVVSAVELDESDAWVSAAMPLSPKESL